MGDLSVARARAIAQAQAAIAAAEKTAMNACASGSFHSPDAHMAPWVVSPVKGDSSTFAERLRKHEEHLMSIKSAMPFETADARTYQTSAPADAHMQGSKQRPALNHLQLPPWSQPAQLPSFSTYFQKSGVYCLFFRCALVILLSCLASHQTPWLQIRLQAKSALKARAAFPQQDREQQSAGLVHGW